MTLVRDDLFREGQYRGNDEQYFRMIHHLESIRDAALPDGFTLIRPEEEELAEHINSCYDREHVTEEEIAGYKEHPVYDPELWIAVRDCSDGRIAASGIAELDSRIGEGILEWIQVSPDHRREGLGSFIVCELLRRLRGRARFATVSGRADSGSSPYELYRACGFTGAVIWHVITEQR